MIARWHRPCVLALSLAAYTAAARAEGPPDGTLDCSELEALEALPPGAAPPRESHFLHLEDLFHRLLADWPARGDEATAAELSDLEQRLAERLECLGAARVAYADQLPRTGSDRPGVLFLGPDEDVEETLTPFLCLAVIEGLTLRPIFDRRPETLLAIARLYQRKQAFQLGQRRMWHARRSLAQVERLLAAWAEGAGDEAAPEPAATILSLAALDLADLRAIATTEEAVAVLHRALELAPRHQLALYLAALYEEKLAEYRHARRHLEVLDLLLPGDPEMRLRLALQRARTGQERRARGELAELTRASPDWVGIVAAQELATLLLSAGETDAAASRLAEALERHPGSSQLRLQLAQVRHADWQASWPLVDEVLNGWSRDRGEPARVEYERPRLPWVRQAAGSLDGRLQPSRRQIAAGAELLRGRTRRQKRADAARARSLCYGTLPLRRLSADPGEGPFAPEPPEG